MSNENEPIPSPFSNVKKIEKQMSAGGMVEKMTEEFTKMLFTFNQIGIEPNQHTLATFSAGFLGTLKVIGFTKEDAEKISTLFVKCVTEAGISKCDCYNCKNK